MLAESNLIVEYEVGEGGVEGENESRRDRCDDLDHEEEKHTREAPRPRAMRWNTSEASRFFPRRYGPRESAPEHFLLPSSPGRTQEAAAEGCQPAMMNAAAVSGSSASRDGVRLFLAFGK
mmetsp:Transcript_49609/g.105421  ORF Transcript_49609/g.105421 Transcript_49609/m.105421 type:complete len:120 (+) Transcript_49609:700-1059(+)